MIVFKASQKKGKYPEEPMRTQPTKLSNARENAGNQVVIGFSIASVWLRKWREFLDGSQSQSDPGLLLVLEGFIYPPASATWS